MRGCLMLGLLGSMGLAVVASAADWGQGGWPGVHAPPPRVGPAPSPRLPPPVTPRPELRVTTTPPRTGVSPLQRALEPAPAPASRDATATQHAVDDLMRSLGVEDEPRRQPFGGRCAHWDRNLQTCLD